MNPREQFEKETGMTTGIMFAHSVGFRDEYVLWLEKELSNLGFAEPIKKSNPEPTINNESIKKKEPCPNCKEIITPCACMRNICIKCGKPVGNITFTVCDECWNKHKPIEFQPIENKDKLTRDELVKKAIEFYKLKYPYANSNYEVWIRRIESGAVDAVDFYLEMKKNNQ